VFSNLLLPFLILGVLVVAPIGVFVFTRRRIKTGSPVVKTLCWTLQVISLLPWLCILFFVGWFAVDNFPFTSGIIAHDSAPTGEEIYIVQTFKGAEPYQVSLYARRPGQPWVWHYLAHQDARWRDCHVEFEGDTLRVSTGSTLRKTFSLAAITVPSENLRDQLPATFTPRQILDDHNKHF
jgi:hypothetical protein